MSRAEIPDLYQVKWRAGNDIKYGIVQRYNQRAEEHFRQTGRVFVEDAIYPRAYDMDIAQLVPIPCTFEECEYRNYVDAECNKAIDASDLLPDQICPGKLFRVCVADGYAWYVVTKVNKKTIRIEWRGFSLDRYVDRRFGYGGTFPKDMVGCFIFPIKHRALFNNRPAEQADA